jgi:hypothetical protein
MILLKPLYAQEPRILERGEVVVLYEESLKAAAEEAVDIYPIVKKELEKILKWRVNFRPTVFLVKRSETFQRMAGSDIVVAFAVPQKKLIVIDHSRMKTDPFTIEVTLKHELCHLLLQHHIIHQNLPRWLNEGIAQWVSGGISEIIMHQKKSLLNEATLAGRYVGMRALTNRFPMERKSLFLAYEASKSLVEYIINQYGMDKLLMTLGYLKDGDGPDEALLKGLSIPFEELEREWHQDLKKRITWLNYVINHIYEILFFLAALIMIYGFIRGFIRKRAYMRQPDDE